MPRPAPRRRQGLLVAAATATANVLAYALSILLSRWLGPDRFGQVAPLLAVALVASVPGMALQAGVARRSARADDGQAAAVAGAGVAVGAAVVLLLLAVIPVLQAVLQLPALAAPVWAAVSLLPQTVCFACLGLLQGREQFGRLSTGLIVVQGARLAGGTAGVLAISSPAGALAGAAAGLGVAAVVCSALAGASLPRLGIPLRLVLRGLVGNTLAVLSIMVLTNIDLLLARNRLSATAAGTYAAGALIAKMAFFAPSFMVVLLFPRLARPDERRGALRTGAVALAASAGLATATAVAGRTIIPLLLGDAYRPIEPLLWLFAAAGSALAGVNLLIQAGLAAGDHRLSSFAWASVVAEVVLVVSFVRSVRGLVLVVLALALALLTVGIALEARARPAGAALPPRPRSAASA